MRHPALISSRYVRTPYPFSFPPRLHPSSPVTKASFPHAHFPSIFPSSGTNSTQIGDHGMRNDKTEAVVARMAAVKQEIDASFVLLGGGKCCWGRAPGQTGER